MITAVDTNVLLDVLGADESFGEASRAALRRCFDEGALVACEVVWAETAAWFTPIERMTARLASMGIRFEPLDAVAAQEAGAAWRNYRGAGGPRRRLLADFLVGGHAWHHAERLLTRDRGFYRAYFRDLAIVDPAEQRG